IGALLGASSLQALATLEQLMAQSRSGAAEAIALAAAAQNLGSRSQALERAARQSLILGDAQLRRHFDETRQDAQATLQSLQQRGLPPQLGEQWNGRLAQVAALLQGPAAQSLDSERAVAALFLDIDTLNAAIAQAVQELNARRSG